MTRPDAERRLRRTVLLVAILNLAYFVVEVTVALSIDSVSLLADSVDFLEDTAVNLLVLLALGWSLAARARSGRVMALVVLAPALAAGWQLITEVGAPTAPDASSLVLTAGGAVLVNSAAAWLLAGVRTQGGSLGHAAWVAARNDVVVNLAVIVMAGVTAVTGSGWPDLALGSLIVVVNVRAAREVWELATEEQLAARALAGGSID